MPGVKFIDWLDSRTGLRRLVHAGLYEPIPGGSRWRYVWGSTLVVAFLTQVITGVFLWMAYSPSTQTAWESVFYIQYEMTGGWLLRGVHHFMAQAMVVLLALHFVQVVWDGAYRAPRELNFVLGLLLMLVVMGLALTGYLLPWDQKGYWATNVATNLASQAPLAGADIRKLAIGGSSYGHETLTRFFALHAGVLPGLLVGLLALHVALFRRHGLHARTPLRGPEQTFWPDQVLKDSVAALGVLVVVLGLTIYFGGAELMAPADSANPYDAARPEWYFLFLFQFLKWFPGRLELLGAFVIPGVVTLLLFLMPWIGRTRRGHWVNVAVLVLLLGGAAMLTAGALYDDYYAALNDDPAGAFLTKVEQRQKEMAKYETSKQFLAAKQDAEREAERVIELAGSPDRIPPTGALTLVYDDPYIQGPRLFKQNCANCHSFESHAYEEARMFYAKLLGGFPFPLPPASKPIGNIVNSIPTAPNLAEIPLRSWYGEILAFKGFTGSNHFGYRGSPFVDGDMASFLRDNRDAVASGKDAAKIVDALHRIELVLYAEGSQVSEKLIRADERKDFEGMANEGRKLISGGLADILPSGTSCVDCHKFHDAGKLGDAPDLTGYMSREWMIDFVKNPAAERFYGDKNDRMPAFAPHDDPKLNQLDQKSIELIVDWLRGDWKRPAAPGGTL